MGLGPGAKWQREKQITGSLRRKPLCALKSAWQLLSGSSLGGVLGREKQERGRGVIPSREKQLQD